ncbi:MAG: hypothetical protein ACP5H8_02570 [Candidatus Micrarchaeia archaeon]
MDFNEMLAYGTLGASFVLLLFASQFAPIALIAIVLAGVSYLFYAWGNIYVPFLTQFKKDIYVDYKYELPASEDALIKKEGEDYIATVFLNLDVYETMTNKSDDEIKEYARYFERTISSIRDPIKLCAIIYERDMRKYIENIEEKKAEVENAIATERQKKKVDEREIEVLEREKLMWERRLESLYKGTGKPMAVAYIVSVSAKGATKDSALSAARVKAKEIKATFTSGMSLRVDELAHNRMRMCYEWEAMSPEW